MVVLNAPRRRSALAGHTLPHVVAQFGLDHSLGDPVAAALHALGDLRHLGGEAALHSLLAIGTGESLRPGLVATGSAGCPDLFAQSLPARVASTGRRGGVGSAAAELPSGSGTSWSGRNVRRYG